MKCSRDINFAHRIGIVPFFVFYYAKCKSLPEIKCYTYDYCYMSYEHQRISCRAIYRN